MDSLHQLITNHVPSYFRNLPVPKSLGGFLDLKVSDWIRLVTFTGAVGVAGYVTVQGVFSLLPEDICEKLPVFCRRGKRHWCNKSFEKHKPKCSDHIDIEDIGKKASLCRCWKSAKMPYCDGAHKKHNRNTGDNVGPVTVKRKDL